MPRVSRGSFSGPTDPSDDRDSPTAPSRRAARAMSRAHVVDQPKDSKRERTKDGCLTCRMRRKKCETNLTADGSCTTCARLRIDCYGFGAKRPDWMKDKALVEKKLQEIKDHLVAEGLVRGVAKDKSAKKPARRGESSSKSPPPPQPTIVVPGPPSRPSSPVIVPSSRGSPTSPRKTLPITRPDTSVVIPPIAPLSHPAPERNNPQYLPSRAASRSPVLGHAAPRSPMMPPPLLATHHGGSGDSDSSEEHSPQTPPGSFDFQYVMPAASTSTGGGGGQMADWSVDAFSLDPNGNPEGSYGMGSSYADPFSMEQLATGLVPFAPVPQHAQGSGMFNLFGPYSFNDFSSDYTLPQDSENISSMLMQRGVPPALTGQIVTQSFQSPFELMASWPNFFASPPIRAPSPFGAFGSVQEDGFMYYFSNVATMQYIFDKSSTDTMHGHIRTNPNGVVATAIKMIAAMHDSQYRKARGLEAGGALRTSSTPEHLYRETCSKIRMSYDSNGKVYTEADATAALHMISYWLFQGGDGEWFDALKVAVIWFKKFGELFTKRATEVINGMTSEQRFAAKTTMWMDIFSSITKLKEPYLVGLYKHLLSMPGTTEFFDTINGCCDEVMFLLASIASLEYEMDLAATRALEIPPPLDSHGRKQQMAMFSHQARMIRERLERIDCSPPKIHEVAASYLIDDPPSTPSSYAIPPPPTSYSTSNIFRNAALVYLSTVMRGVSPAVPETAKAVWDTYQAFLALPPSDMDRSLVFPVCIAGCMTDDPVLRQYFSERLRVMDVPVGNCGKTIILMESVWKKRDELYLRGAREDPTILPPGFGWRDVMRETKLELLLV